MSNMTFETYLICIICLDICKSSDARGLIKDYKKTTTMAGAGNNDLVKVEFEEYGRVQGMNAFSYLVPMS